MEPWYRVATPRKEVREGRSFNPDEFAIALEQVVVGTAPEDYRDPAKFFARTCFTRALREHAGMVLRRLAGKTEHTAPVLTLITQFGGGKTHTLTALYHVVRHGASAADYPGVAELLQDADLSGVPDGKVGVFVGNAWDPQEGRETPWIDLARQLAGDIGVTILGTAAKTTPPGTEAIGRLFQAAGGAVLILFDEVLNFMNRHRSMAESFHAFIQNLTVATTGTTHGAAVVSLPRSQVEMTDWDFQWQERITKVVRRVAAEIQAAVRTAEVEAEDEVWGGYRFAVLAENQEPEGLKVIDLGAGHAGSSETLCGRVIAALKSQALLNESVGAGYLERHWPPALKESGAWPLASLRQSFLNGALTRLLDPDTVLRGKLVEFVAHGDFGLASGPRPDGGYEHVWYAELIAPEEVAFEAGVFLLTKGKAKALTDEGQPESIPESVSHSSAQPTPTQGQELFPTPGLEPSLPSQTVTLRLVGTVPPEVWNRLGTKVIPKLKSGADLTVGVEFAVSLSADLAACTAAELRQIMHDLGLEGQLKIEQTRSSSS